jgi:hypothetical protein
MGFSLRRVATTLLLGMVLAPLTACGSSSSGEGAQAPARPEGSASAKPGSSECNALIDVINSGVTRVERMQSPSSSGNSAADDLLAMAKATDDLVAAAGRVKVTSPELAEMSAEYQRMAREVATAARAMAAAVRARDPGAIEDAQHAIEKAVLAEDPLVESINHFCKFGEKPPPRPPSAPRDSPDTQT